MAFCSSCGHQLVDGSKFCPKCGSPMEKKQGSNEISLNAEISIRVVLKGKPSGNTDVEVYLPHLSKTVAVKVPNSISIGQSLRLRGLGHTSPDGEKGDAYIRIVQIDYDNTVQERQEPQRTVRYEGEVRVCPQCKEVINAFVSVCPACGHELRGSKATSVVHELALKLEITDDEQKKDELIRTFYIPNTKEDILEFFILALSQVKIGGMNTDAWMVKLDQAFQKAELSFGNTLEFERLVTMYKDALKLNKRNSKNSRINKLTQTLLGSGFLWALVFGISGVMFLLINIPFGSMILYVIAAILLYTAFMIALFAIEHLEERKKKKRMAQQKVGRYGITTGKRSVDFLQQNFEDEAEYLRSLGFVNIVVKPEKKGFLDTEGAIKGISIAGNSDFRDDDEFKATDKIIIRYHSRRA